MVAPVSAAMRQKIPVVIIDSGLKGEDYVSFVATDNEVGGRLGGEKLAALLGGKGRVVLLRYAEGSDSTTKREEGFLSAMKANPGIEIVSSNQYLGADVEGARTARHAVPAPGGGAGRHVRGGRGMSGQVDLASRVRQRLAYRRSGQRRRLLRFRIRRR